MFFLYSCQVGQARALYNFGNVYHAKGKSICWSGAEPGDFPEEVMMALRKAAEYYEWVTAQYGPGECVCVYVSVAYQWHSDCYFRANLTIVKELGDRAAQGRTYGNLGNTHYLLGNFRRAVASHEQVWCNPQSTFFLSKHICIDKDYKCWVDPVMKYASVSLFVQRLLIAKEFGDRSAERRAYCNLGNAYIFLGEFEVAAEHYK